MTLDVIQSWTLSLPKPLTRSDEGWVTGSHWALQTKQTWTQAQHRDCQKVSVFIVSLHIREEPLNPWGHGTWGMTENIINRISDYDHHLAGVETFCCLYFHKTVSRMQHVARHSTCQGKGKMGNIRQLRPPLSACIHKLTLLSRPGAHQLHFSLSHVMQ